MMNCPHCQTELPPHARFCMNCGQPVSETPKDRPKAASSLTGERKVLTALFADVVGSTALAEQMDPEDWSIIMNRAFERFSPAIERYDGLVVRLLGDAMLALFGAPNTHEDDPARAIRASLDILEAAQQVASEINSEYNIPFSIRIGINTGPVVVGEIGSDLRTEYTAMGDAVNLAARMQSAARPMTTLISEYTHRYVAPLFDSIDLGLIEVKGKSDPVRVFEVRGVKAEPGRLRGVAGLESPMVGRARELSALIEQSVAMQKGEGRAVVIIGEAGLGKSRLTSEWRAAITSNETASVQWATGQCLSYGQGLAYHLVLDLLRSLIGVSSAASEVEIRAALQGRTEDLFDESAIEIFPFLAHLLSLTITGESLERVNQLDPQALQGRYLSAMRQMIRAMANRHPLILLLEDIHWADPSSVEMLSKLLSLAQEAPVLFCFVSRPDIDSSGWKLIQTAHDLLGNRFTEIELLALSDDASREMVANLLEIEALPEIIRDTILKRAEGNPFFVEEVIRMLIDRGAIHQEQNRWVAQDQIAEVEIPDNLQGLLLARIDRLPEDVKHTLRVAAVIGRQFPVTVLEHVLKSQGSL